MKQEHSLSFRYKLIAGFVVVILILSASMGITLYRMFKVTHLGIDAIENRYPMAMLAHDAVFKINQAQSYLHSYILTGDTTYYKSYKKILDHLSADIDHINQYESVPGEVAEVPGTKLDATLRLLGKLVKAGERIDYLQKNPRDNFLLLTEAAERLNPLALQYLGFLNEYIEEMRDIKINRRNLDILNRLTDLRHNWSQMLAGLRIALVSHTLDNMADVITYLDVSRIQLNELQELNPELGVDGMNTLARIHEKYDTALDDFRRRYEKSVWREDLKLMKTVILPSMHDLETRLSQVSTRQSEISRKVGVLLTDTLEGIQTGAVIILILGVLLAVVVATLLIQSLVKPLYELIRAANDVASGNLSARVTPQANDEFGELAVRFNDMVSRLRSEMNQKDVVVSELTYKVNQAEQSSIEKSEFLARLSYEFRIPLTTMIGYAEVILSDAKDVSNKTQAKITENIIESGGVLLHLVDEVVVLADMESGNVELQSSNVRVKDIIKMTLDVMQSSMEAHGVGIQVKESGEGKSKLYIDLSRLTHAFYNIINYLIRSMPKEADILLVCERRSETRLRFNFVSDVAIATEEEISTIFQISHYRSNNGLISSEASMGLVIARKIISVMEGRIGTSIQKKGGLTIWVEFESI